MIINQSVEAGLTGKEISYGTPTFTIVAPQQQLTGKQVKALIIRLTEAHSVSMKFVERVSHVS